MRAARKKSTEYVFYTYDIFRSHFNLASRVLFLLLLLLQLEILIEYNIFF